MPPVFGPSSPSNARLKSCAGGSGMSVRAVAQREDRDLPALEQFLDDERLAERFRQRAAPLELVLRAADEDALAGREAVGLDHARRLRDRHRLGRRDSGRAHHVLREALRAFDRAAAALGPKRRRRSVRSASATPATSGASGPTREVDRERRARARAGPRRPPRAPDDSAEAAIPGLPGRACSSVRPSSARASTRARARARPTRRGAPSRRESKGV